jgi:type II secretory pathway component PulF
MFFSPRMHLKPLAALSRRLAISTSAGLEDRRIWASEADRGRRTQRVAAAHVRDSLARGRSIPEALDATGEYFPPLFRQMVAVGEETGTLDRTYARLADHYEHMLATRRTLLGALAWPGIQLALAVLTIGGVIYFSAMLNLKDFDGNPLDVFGFGLTGPKGLTIYITLVITAAIAALLGAEAVRRGALSIGPLQRGALAIPGLGNALRTLAMARFTWALQLVLDTAMDLRKALPLALDATGNDAYRRLGPQVVRNISQGMSLHAALAETGAFPGDLLDALSVGEQSGMLAETMQRQSAEYERRAKTAISVIARIAGGVVWALVAVMLIVLIFRVYGNYISTINKLAAPGGGI